MTFIDNSLSFSLPAYLYIYQLVSGNIKKKKKKKLPFIDNYIY